MINELIADVSRSLRRVARLVASRHVGFAALFLILITAVLAGHRLRPAAAAFPGENGLIAFASERDGNGEIYVMDADGDNQRNLTQESAEDYSPKWSPDGLRILFESYRDGNFEIYLMDADGGNPTNLTGNPANDVSPSWSPDGTRFAFASNRDDGTDIFVMPVAGGQVTQLTDGDEFTYNARPAWSPDGSKILYVVEVEGTKASSQEIWVMDADGGNKTNLTNHEAPDTDPDWSPDGSRIVFASTRDGPYDLYVMDTDGGNVKRMTNDGAVDFSPVWSPDGTMIAWAKGVTVTNYEIMSMSVNGSPPVNLTQGDGEDLSPNWQAILDFPPVPMGLYLPMIRR